MPPRGENLETALERAVRGLGSYYGAISRDDFVAMLLMRERQLGEQGAFTIPEITTPARVAARALLDVTEGGYTTPGLIQQLNSYVGDGSSGNSSQDNDIPGLIKICYEPAAFGAQGEQDRARVLLREDTRPIIGAGNGVQQGHNRGTDPSRHYSLKSITGLESTTESANGSPITVNAGNQGSGSDSVNFSVIQVFANRLSPASRDMGALQLFMNAIPTIEMSRAVPYINVTLIQEGDHFDADNRVSSLSMGQFLLGNRTVNPGSIERAILGANDAIVVAENERNPEFSRQQTADGQTNTVTSPISTAGMELFTSPQTLVNADDNHIELDELVGNEEAQIRRQSPVIDKFRPLMSFKNLSFNVSGAGGMMSYKSGKMSLVVHDRSRLAEVSPFVRPAQFGNTHLLIEYGWSHPDAPENSALGASDNLFGSLIGALKVREKYQIVNSSFSFDDAGQVEVEVQLSMLAERSLRQVQVGLGLDTVPEFQQLKHLTDMISALRDRISPATAQSIFGESDIIGSLTNPAGAASDMSPESIRQIRNVSRVARSSGQSADLRQLGQALANLMGGQQRDGGVRANFRNAMERKIQQKVGSLMTTSDPFLVSRSSNPTVNPNQHVSLGKVLATFIGAPIIASGHFKDVQLIFYSFNEKASYMANRNIATFPIKKSEFETTLKRELDQLINMPVESFVNFMGTYYLSDPAAEAYGFSSLYEANRDNDGNRQLREQYRENNAGLFDQQQQVLRAAYGQEVGSDLEFKQPTVSVIMETVPVREQGREDQTILRLHICDAQATAHATVQALLEAASSRSIGLLNTAALNVHQELNRSRAPGEAAPTSESRPDFDRLLAQAVQQGILEPHPRSQGSETPGGENEGRRQRYRIKGGFATLKSFIMRTVPSLRYGEGSSGIISAKVSSMSDPALTTVSIQRQGRSPESPTGARQQGVPLSISPVECTMETIGCPLWSFGQQIFIDFGTGTTVDSVYGVTGVDHTIGPGEFKTTVKLTPMSTYARYTSLVANIENAVNAINDISPPGEGEQPISIPSPTPRPRASDRRGAAGRGRQSATENSTGGTGQGASERRLSWDEQLQQNREESARIRTEELRERRRLLGLDEETGARLPGT